MSYWSVEGCAWTDALVTPWSTRGVDQWSFPHCTSAAEVLRQEPSAPAVPADAVPGQAVPVEDQERSGV